MLKLTRKQELQLIDLGLETLLNRLVVVKPKPVKKVVPVKIEKKKYRLSAAARKAVSVRMSNYWAKRRKAKSKTTTK